MTRLVRANILAGIRHETRLCRLSTLPSLTNSSSLSSEIGKLSQTGLASLASTILAPYSPGAKDNIILNDDEDSNFKYIELNKNEIRLEFEDTSSPVYQFYTQHWTERSESGTIEPIVDKHSHDLRDVVTDIRNNTFCGAGATVMLCREGVQEILKRHLSGSTEESPELISSEEDARIVDVTSG
eukprot:CAMPEP_0114512336 /NCGR_PEP_ID=MMETSP0109-20121206/14919_1 /TAXON_ID=29199 /ORGANISM="Chlorarachnion reptans, Strain CCCM449" /LENGTH=183 /DNA_ID=CAMNT_0001692009 /DNA_START=197 /DNA_END=748 /DNA_ORIENTATION=+